MSTDIPNSTEDLAGDMPDHPSMEEVVDRLEKIGPTVMSREKLSVFDVSGKSIGNYTICRIVGRGAFGVVYQAYDEQLGRDVALKVPRPEVLIDEDKLRRFEREAATSAMLEHPSIIPIYEANLTGPTPYIASAFCLGPDLSEWLAIQETPIPADQAAQFVMKLAGAVQYAHERGVLHRDLKPSNVMLDLRNTVMSLTTETDEPQSNTTNHSADKLSTKKDLLADYEPRLTDFGLSKLTDNNQEITRSSMAVGTPMYMAPEQIDSSIGPQTESTDIYGLGSILYELLVGKPPFEKDNVAATLLALQQEDAVAPRHFIPELSRDLNAICLKCLEKRPTKRYATADDLVKDLNRYLAGEPTQARPLGPMGWIARWVDHNRLASAFVAVVVVSLAVITVETLWYAKRITAELDVSQALREKAELREAETRRSYYLADMRLISQMIGENSVAPARKRLNSYAPPSPYAVERDFPWYYLWEHSDNVKQTFRGHSGLIRSMTVVPGAGLLISGGDDKIVRFFDQDSAEEVARLPKFAGKVNAVAITPDEQVLITGVDKGSLILWDISGIGDGELPKEIVKLDGHVKDILCLAVSPDGKFLASAGAGGVIFLWELSTKKLIHKLEGHLDWIRELDFSPDGMTLASVSHDDYVVLWNVAAGKETARVEITKDHRLGLSVRFHPNGKYLAAGNSDGQVQIIRLEDLETVWTFNIHFSWIRSIDFSDDGRVMAIAGTDPFVRLIQLDDQMQGTVKKTFRGNGNETWCIKFLDDGRALATSGMNGRTKIWWLSHRLNPVSELTSDEVSEINLREEVICRRLTASQDREFILLSGHHGAWLVDARNYPKRRSLTYMDDLVLGGTISFDGDWVAVISWSSISIWNTRLPGIDYTYNRDSKGWRFTAVAFNAANDILALGTDRGEIRLLQFPSLQEITRLQPFENTRVSDALYTPDGRYFVASFSGVWDQTPKTTVLWDAKTHTEVTRINDIIRLLAISPDSRLLALVDNKQQIVLWNIENQQELLNIGGHHDRILSADFSPDGKYLATTAGVGPIKLWSTDTGQLVLNIDPGLQYPQFIFGPGGTAFATDLEMLSHDPGIDYRHRMIRLLPKED